MTPSAMSPWWVPPARSTDGQRLADVIVAAALTGLFLRGAVVIAGQGRAEIRASKSPPPNRR